MWIVSGRAVKNRGFKSLLMAKRFCDKRYGKMYWELDIYNKQTAGGAVVLKGTFPYKSRGEIIAADRAVIFSTRIINKPRKVIKRWRGGSRSSYWCNL